MRRKDLLALLVTAPAPSIGAALAFHLAPGAVGQVGYLLGKAVLYGLPVVWLRYVAREPLGLSPLRRGGLGFGVVSGLGLALGIGLGFALLSAHVGDAALRTAVIASGIDSPARYLLAAAWLVLVNALLEEYAFRWFLYGRCRALLPPLLAGGVAALIFTAHHVIVLSAFFDGPIVAAASCGVFAGGVVWTWSYERYGSIWPGYVSHAIADVAILAVGWTLLAPAF